MLFCFLQSDLDLGRTGRGQDHEKLSRAQRASDWVAEWCGSWSFIVSFALIVLVWIVLNAGLLLWLKVFDPYPYILLNLFLTVISTFQGPLIMMSQNRQADRDREEWREGNRKLDTLIQSVALLTPADIGDADPSSPTKPQEPLSDKA